MNYIRHLTGFFQRAAEDEQLNSTHVSLYMSIFQLWNVNRFKNPVSISRSELMQLSKVSSKTTYHKCMKDLQHLGYLLYEPSYHPLKGSWARLVEFDEATTIEESNFCPSTGLVLDRSWTSSGQVVYKLPSESEARKGFQSPLNIYKHIKHNKLSLRQLKQKIKKRERKKIETKNEKNNVPAKASVRVPKDFSGVSEQKNCSRMPAQNSPEKVPENEAQVVGFFLESGYEQMQAVKFYHYYSAIGWKVGGEAPIENWRSAAHGWILKSKKIDQNGKSFKQPVSAGRLHAGSNKNYSEPL